MPAFTERQRRFFGAELGRKREGRETETGLGEEQLRDFARLPLRKRGRHRGRERGRREHGRRGRRRR